MYFQIQLGPYIERLQLKRPDDADAARLITAQELLAETEVGSWDAVFNSRNEG